MRAGALRVRERNADRHRVIDQVGLGRWRLVVEERAAPRKPFDAEQLLRVEGAVVLAELRVALVRHLAALDIEHAGSPATGLLVPF